MLDTAQPGGRPRTRPVKAGQCRCATAPASPAARRATAAPRGSVTAPPGSPQRARRARPASTYRLQLQPGFGFADAAAVAPATWPSLGVTHAYLSPILQAAPGSAHGYDVVDHSRISDEPRRRGRVPGHGGAAPAARPGHGRRHRAQPHGASRRPSTLNRQLWSVLRDGPRARRTRTGSTSTGRRGDGRLLLPVLAGAGSATACGRPARWTPDGGPDGEPVLRYFEHVLPLRPGTADLPLRRPARAQHYRLAGWRAAATELNWRRFFDVTSLIAVRVEDPDVFAATHACCCGWWPRALIDGLRIDHPDGLADPRGYLRQLAAATGGALGGGREDPRRRPRSCPPTGPARAPPATTRSALIGGLFTDPAGAAPLTAEYARFTGGRGEFAAVARGGQAGGGHRQRWPPRSAGWPGCWPGRRSRAGRRARRRPARPCWPSCSPRSRSTGRTWCPGEPRRAGRSRPVARRRPRPAARRLPRRAAGAAVDGAPRWLLGRGVGPGRPGPRGRARVPVRFQQTCGPVHGQGRRGHRVLPLAAAGSR